MGDQSTVQRDRASSGPASLDPAADSVMSNRYSPSGSSPRANSSAIAACPSYELTCCNPAMDATASKSLPALVVYGAFTPRSSIVRSAVSSLLVNEMSGCRSPRPKTSEPSISYRSPTACRRGSLMAFSPPGSRNRLNAAARSNDPPSVTRNSPPQIVPSVPYPVPSHEMPRTVPRSPFSAIHEATCAW